MQGDGERLRKCGLAQAHPFGDPEHAVLVGGDELRERPIGVHAHAGRVPTGAERRTPGEARFALPAPG